MTKKFFIPKRGDTVRVRKLNGEVISAKYIREIHLGCEKPEHLIFSKNDEFIAMTSRKPILGHECRFIGPSCDLKEIAKCE